MSNLLILTLGTGNRNQEEYEKRKAYSYDEFMQYIVNQRKEDNVGEYKLAKYGYKGRQKESPFVGDILLEIQQPDAVAVMGTTESIWAEMLTWFAKPGDGEEHELYQDWKKLLEIESDKETELTDQRAKEVSGKIEAVFKRWEIFGEKVKIRIFTMFYGRTDEELKKNYNMILKINDLLDADKVNEVSFDITHAFRSLSVYNLTVINYLKNAQEMKIQLKHIYYGAFEMKDKDGVAPVLDLQYLAKIMNLSEGAKEFRDTGNTRALLEAVGENDRKKDDRLWNNVEEFHWAMQMNTYDQISKVIRDILRNSNSGTVEFADQTASSMVTDIVRKWFGREKHAWDDAKDKPECQYLISRWYYEHDRYGIAAATGFEALKAYLMVPYMKWMHLDEFMLAVNIDDEIKRREAFKRLNDAALNLAGKVKQSEMERQMIELNEKALTVRDIRNAFAHNLDSDKDENRALNTVATADRTREMDEFFSSFERFRSWMDDDKKKKEFIDAYCFEKEKKAKIKTDKPDKPVKVIITTKSKKYLEKVKPIQGKQQSILSKCEANSKKKHAYETREYFIDKPDCQSENTGTAQKSDKPYSKLRDFLKQYETEKMQIVFVHTDVVETICYRDFLYKEGYSDLFYFDETAFAQRSLPKYKEK